jgi:hypothetical protein
MKKKSVARSGVRLKTPMIFQMVSQTNATTTTSLGGMRSDSEPEDDTEAQCYEITSYHPRKLGVLNAQCPSKGLLIDVDVPLKEGKEELTTAAHKHENELGGKAGKFRWPSSGSV